MKEDILDDDSIPQWDVALAALVYDECRKQARRLTIDDFKHLAQEHSIRFDDIMETIFRLCIHDEWEYQDADGNTQTITQDTLDGLYVNARLDEDDLRGFSGSWQPLN